MKPLAFLLAVGASAAVAAEAQAQGGCVPGQIVIEAGVCCWPNQVWVREQQQCRGIPSCAKGYVAQGESCVLASADAPQPVQASAIVPPPAPPPAPPPVLGAQPAVAPLPTPTREEGGLKLTAGTFRIGGHLDFSIDTTVRDADPLDPNAVESSKTGYDLSINPELGYFVANRVMLGIGGIVGRQFGDLYKTDTGTYGVWLTGLYFAPFNPTVAFYTGLRAGVEYFEASSRTHVLFALPLGLAVALNSHVALDFGIRVNLRRVVAGSPAYTSVTLPIGFLGVQIFN